MAPTEALKFFEQELVALRAHREVLRRGDDKGTPNLDRKIGAHEKAVQALALLADMAPDDE